MTHTETSLRTVELSLTAGVSALKDCDEELFRISQDKNACITFEQKRAVNERLKAMEELTKSIRAYVE